MKCFLWFHDWDKWQTGEGEFETIFSRQGYTAVIQTRVCKECGLRQIRRLK